MFSSEQNMARKNGAVLYDFVNEMKCPAVLRTIAVQSSRCPP